MLKISYAKSSVMLFNKSSTLDFPLEVRVGQSDYLEEKMTLRLLGEIVKRGTKKLWLQHRLKQLGLEPTTVLEYWVSEGRPLLEYSCPLWTRSIPVLQSRSLEAVQKFAMAICYNSWDLSYSEALVRAGFPRLDTRRRELTRTWGERVAKQPGQTFFTPSPVVTRGAKRFLEPFCR